jgi:rhodanese-related sulfurtransferase
MTEEEFSKELLSEQPFIPKYFGYDVELNKTGVPSLQASLAKIPVRIWKKTGGEDGLPGDNPGLDPKYYVIDTRDQASFTAGHLKNSIHLMQQGKFETWLGSIIAPHEKFYLVADSNSQLQEMMKRTASIGYELQIEQAIILGTEELSATGSSTMESTQPLDVTAFTAHKDDFTIVDVRNIAERKGHPIFADSLGIPLGELRERVGEIPLDKPVVLHCAGGYRSAAGSSLLQAIWKEMVPVFDMGPAIRNFQ